MPKFRTLPLSEAAARATYPGQQLYICADCHLRVCRFEDADPTTAECSFICPTCRQARQDCAKGGPTAETVGFLCCCSCPACRAAADPARYAQIVSWNAYAAAKNGAIR